MLNYVEADDSHKCSSCKSVKPRSEFHKRSSRKVGIAPQCKACAKDRYSKWRAKAKDSLYQQHRTWVKEHPEEVRAHWRKANKKKYTELREFLNSVKNVPCLDCGLRFHPYVMDFDHRDPKNKKGLVSNLSRFRTKKALLEEIAKCDIVCANCHRLRTLKRGNSDWS